MFLFSDNRFSRIIRRTLAAAAILNLIFLFVFDYQIPFISHASEDTSVIEPNSTETTYSNEAADKGWSFVFDSDTFEYDGTGDLDLLSGVTLKDADGNDSDIEIYTHIKTGASLTEKIVTYVADTPDGELSSDRTLNLVGYAGPSISIPESMPSETEEGLNNLLSDLSGDEAFFAGDGFGGDITDQITVAFTMNPGSTDATALFSVTNIFNDTVSATATVSVTLSKPLLTLTTNDVTLQVGAEFIDISYVANAIDVDGSDLRDSITTTGTVDTNVTGDYAISYSCTGKDGAVSDTKTLNVHVTE